MTEKTSKQNSGLPSGVIFNAYPDSLGRHLSEVVKLFKRPELRDAFSLFYILPTFFNSDLDRGFSVIDYDMNKKLVSEGDLKEFEELDVMLKFDLVLNHLSVGSPQFQDMLQNGDASRYKDFFIDWNDFWEDHGEMGPEGHMMPLSEHLEKLFLRKPDLPILKVRFPDGTERPYWNTFYQHVSYAPVAPEQFTAIEGIDEKQAQDIAWIVNAAIEANAGFDDLDFGQIPADRQSIMAIVEQNREYLGQMDLNARAETVWEFYDETLKKLRDYGAKFVRLDAFAYLHKHPGEVNFFNKPGTWEYLGRLRKVAEKYGLILIPEIHAEYGQGLHEEVAAEGFTIYDFFFPGLVIDALDRGTTTHLLAWIHELREKNIHTINMLGCHDGIPVLDLKGKEVDGVSRPGLLSDEQIDAVIDRIMDRGGRVKNLFGADGKKISYYQVNATFFSALGEDERKMRLARAIQLFMPGIPQVWYLDLFAGKNNYHAADKGGPAGHKEINRTALTRGEIEQRLKRIVVRDQLELIRLRNTSRAFTGDLQIHDASEHLLHLTWQNDQSSACLRADLRAHAFEIIHIDEAGEITSYSYR